MLIMINQCLLNLFVSMTKALSGQISPKQKFYSPHLSMLFFFFTLPFFISTDPTPVESLCLVRQSCIMNPKLVEINQNETPSLMP